MSDLDFTNNDDLIIEPEEIVIDSDDTSEFLIDIPVVPVDLDDDDDSFDIDISEDLELEDTFAAIDVLSVLSTCLDKVNAIVSLSQATEKKGGNPDIYPDYRDFSYMGQKVFRVFSNILSDVASNPEYQSLSLKECQKLVESKLYEVTLWVSDFYEAEFTESFGVWFNRIRRVKLATANAAVEKHGALSLVDMGELKRSLIFFHTNTELFKAINSLVSNGVPDAVNGSFKSPIGRWTREYLEERNLTFTVDKQGGMTLPVSTAYDIVLSLLGSDSLVDILKVSMDDFLTLSAGERFRRLMVYEITTDVISYSMLKSMKSLAGTFQESFGQFIADLQQHQEDSYSFELILLLANIPAVLGDTRTFKGKSLLRSVLNGAFNFLQDSLRDRANVIPVFYTGVSKRDDGDYSLEYIFGEEASSITSETVLCEVIGDRSNAYCIPSVKQIPGRCTVCPPLVVVNELTRDVGIGATSVSGAITYRFTPTLNWLENNGISTRSTVVSNPTEISLRNADNPFLMVLLNYSNKFEDSGQTINLVNITANGYVLHSVNRPGSSEGSYELGLVERIVGTEEDGSPVLEVVAHSGDLTYIPGTIEEGDDSGETRGFIHVAFWAGKQFVEFSSFDGEYTENVLGVEVEQAREDFSLSYIIHLAKMSAPVEYQQFRKAIKSLCGLVAFDYEEELEIVQEIICRELYYVVDIPFIDKLLSSRMLDFYYSYIETSDEGVEAIDEFNLSSMSELCGIVNSQSSLNGIKQWPDNALKVLSSERDSFVVGVDDCCRRLDSLDLDVLALQVLSNNKVVRLEYNLQMYRALHAIPEIGSRLSRLEDRMIAFRVLSSMGNQVVSLFGKKAYFVKGFRAQLTSGNLEAIGQVLLDRSKRKIDGTVFALSKKVLENSHAGATALKYFVLERNLYGILDVVYSSPDKYEGLYQKFLEELLLPDGFDIKSVSQDTLGSMVEGKVYERFWAINDSLMLKWVYEGALAETVSNNYFNVIKAYDMFCVFYDMLVRLRMEDDQPRYFEDLMSYAGSFLISYCIIKDSSAGNVACGELRPMAYAKDSKDFVYESGVLDFFRPYQLQDLRTMNSDD